MRLCRRFRALLVAGSTALLVTGLSGSPAQAAPPTGQEVIISNYVNNAYLSTDDQNTRPNQHVQIWDRDPMVRRGEGSIWRITSRGDGTYSISASEPHGGSPRVCLTNEKGERDSWGAVKVRTCDSGDRRQAWIVNETSRHSYIHTIVPAGNPDYALGPDRGTPHPDTYVRVTRQWGGTPAAVQMWKINPVPN